MTRGFRRSGLPRYKKGDNLWLPPGYHDLALDP